MNTPTDPNNTPTPDAGRSILARYVSDPKDDGSYTLSLNAEETTELRADLMRLIPRPAPVPADAKDAARYRYLRTHWDDFTGTTWRREDIPHELDSAVDAELDFIERRRAELNKEDSQ